MPEIINGIIYGDQNFMIPSHMNCGKFFIDKLLKSKEKIALINGATGETITFGDMVQRIVNTAGALTRLGIKRDDVVGVCSENRMEYLITAIAIWCSGATATFLNSGYSKNEMVHSVNISKPKYVFMSPDTYKNYYETILNTNIVEKFFAFGSAVSDPKLTSFDEFSRTYVDVQHFRPPTDTNGLARTALILYSSGTTGLPKGVKLTHFNLITSGSHPDQVNKDLRCLTIAPWSNTVGIMCTLDNLKNQRTVIFLSKFREEQYLQCIATHKAGLLLVVPPLVVMLTKSSIIQNYDTTSVELMYCGGAPLDLAVMLETKRRFPNLVRILQGYGMTESTGVLTEESTNSFKEGSVGRVALGNIVKVADVETGKTLGPRQEGEVRIKGPSLFGGYIGKNINDDLDEDGFFKTGDICYYDEDGYFFFVDRIKELIKYKAGQVSPSELEALLLQHPAVKDVGVVGKPDPLVGELPTAFIVKKPGVHVTQKELIDFVAGKVSSWKQLRGGVHFIKEIPKVASGKILRRILRDMLKKPVSKL
ncbi:unnamed protein product [Arctia plantaginis]|uniref:Luciferin 4-monooxygenase n=1 Tax=Arctia plantaginis TaxID=874455 RepID=A0A8S1A491_ARCPL|nr:unnamed protein product [Arctia plantaginis]